MASNPQVADILAFPQRRQKPRPELRGYHVAYHAGCRCPGCARSNWHVGRIMAECAFCGTAIVLAGGNHPEDSDRGGGCGG